MPKATFFNLSEEKKSRIFDAALQEFSIRTFSQASLNRIIRNAGIPKGSFYQYFENKEDLYLYLMEAPAKEKIAIFHNLKETDPDADVFEVVMNATRRFFERGKVKPGYIEAAMLMELDDSEFIVKIRRSSTEKYIKLIERDQGRGLIKPEVDPELVANMISIFNFNECFRNGSDQERYLKNLGDALKIIKDGVAVSRG